MTDIYAPKSQAPTREGNSIRTHLSEALVELADLENRATDDGSAAKELSALKSRIQTRIDILKSQRMLAFSWGQHEIVSQIHIRISELINLLEERG